MADFLRELEEQEYFEKTDGGEMATYDGDNYLQSQTNILTLDENRAPSSTLIENQEYDGFNHSDDEGDHDEQEEQELSPGGVLDENTVARGLSNFGRSADGEHQVYLHLSIPGISLIDISLLDGYTHLQKVEIPYNNITDLSPLSNMPYLLELDASHNQIHKLLDFTPPKNLKVVDLSFNQIIAMSDLSAHHYLMKLNLDNNMIHEIEGLENCKRLTNLSLAHNHVARIQGLDHLPIRILNLRCNEIKKIENLGNLRMLQRLDLSGNHVRSMRGLQKHDFLEGIDLEGNEIIDITEIKYIKDLDMLSELNLLRNPIQELPDYRLSILYRIQRLIELDRRKVEVEEKVASMNMFNPPQEVIAARDHIMHVVYSFLQPSKVWDSTLPSVETPYPMLVLVGPQGAGKKDLALKLVEEFPDYFGYGVSHTTRKPHPEETQAKDYHFVSLDQFEMEIKMGKFLQTYQYHGNWYGLTMESVEDVAREGLACVLHLELEGVLTLKNTYFEPRYVLIMPLSKEAHERRLRERGLYSESQIEWTLRRVDMYIQQNQLKPGFFDMMINSDDITEAYKKLRRLVMDYLGTSVPSPPESEHPDASCESPMTEAELTVTGGSANLGTTRTWSRPSIPDSISQQYAAAVKKSQTPTGGGRGVVEEASLRRRQSAAKEAVAGHVPSIYEQILSRPPRTAPQAPYAQSGLGDRADPGQRSYSAPIKNIDALPPGTPDSSVPSRASSSLSNISDTLGYEEQSDSGSTKGAQDRLAQLPDDTIDPMELLSGSRSQNTGQGSFRSGSRPGSGGSRPGSGGSLDGFSTSRTDRPGSNKHRVLPPISPSPKVAQPNY